ncbi:hypothetical protein, partial [Acidilobus sp.]|uniref:hypothetical protein n=1 Tax=Acidilobus sp. TaxID=1872109 RepID=UPI003D08A9B2
GASPGLSSEVGDMSDGVKHICTYVPLDVYEGMLRIKSQTGKPLYSLISEALSEYVKAHASQS